MTQQTTPQPPAQHRPRPAGIAGLTKMSTTAGVGLQEYRALSPPAVAALVCGLASWLAALHPLLLLVPLAAVVLGGLAAAQIGGSRGTRGGMPLAMLGLVLGAGFLGYVGVGEIAQRSRDAGYRDEINRLVADFGNDLVAGDYRAAYDLTSDGFRREFSYKIFHDSLSQLPLVEQVGRRQYGDYTGTRTNGLAEITPATGAGRVSGQAMLIVTTQNSEPIRQPVLVTRTPDGWRIVEFGVWFPRDPRALRDSGEVSRNRR